MSTLASSLCQRIKESRVDLHLKVLLEVFPCFPDEFLFSFADWSRMLVLTSKFVLSVIFFGFLHFRLSLSVVVVILHFQDVLVCSTIHLFQN